MMKIRHPEKVNKPINPIKKKPNWIKSKIAYAKVTQTELFYVGSITIDEDIMKRAVLTENEKVSGLEIVKQSTKLWEDKFGKKSKFVFIIEPNIKGFITCQSTE